MEKLQDLPEISSRGGQSSLQVRFKGIVRERSRFINKPVAQAPTRQNRKLVHEQQDRSGQRLRTPAEGHTETLEPGRWRGLQCGVVLRTVDPKGGGPPQSAGSRLRGSGSFPVNSWGQATVSVPVGVAVRAGCGGCSEADEGSWGSLSGEGGRWGVLSWGA